MAERNYDFRQPNGAARLFAARPTPVFAREADALASEAARTPASATSERPNGQAAEGRGDPLDALPRHPARPLIVDEEYRALAPPHAAAERSKLEADIKREDRCLVPIIVWRGQNIILDGHNRYEICTRLGIAFLIIEIDLLDHEMAKGWILDQQIDKRNSSGIGLSHMRGLRMRMEKNARGGTGANQHTREQMCHGGTFAPRTSARLAKEYGVSARTMNRDLQLVAWIGAIVIKAEIVAQQLILSPDSGCKHADVRWLAGLGPTELSVYLPRLRAGDKFQRSWRKEAKAGARNMVVPCEPHALAAALTRRLSVEEPRVCHRDLLAAIEESKPRKSQTRSEK